MPSPVLVRPPTPLIAPESVALLPFVSIVPPWVWRVIGSALETPAAAICKVPPVKIGPAEPAGPDASVQASAPDVRATKVNPVASSALPLEQTPGKNDGVVPTGSVATTRRVVVSTTETVLSPKFVM